MLALRLSPARLALPCRRTPDSACCSTALGVGHSGCPSIVGQHASADDHTESGARYDHHHRSSLASMYKAHFVHE